MLAKVAGLAVVEGRVLEAIWAMRSANSGGESKGSCISELGNICWVDIVDCWLAETIDS